MGNRGNMGNIGNRENKGNREKYFIPIFPLYHIQNEPLKL